MQILIIGGTRFVGRALVEAALARNHQITLFNRGQSNPNLFPQVETLIGDRESDLSALNNRTWDAVIDTCGYIPRQVTATAEKLAGAVKHYTFISTISVYDTSAISQHAWIDEDSPLATIEDETVEDINGGAYGPLKALCERAADAAMPGRVLHIRPGLIVGPHDPTDRFTYWPVRLSRGGEAIAPPLSAPVQLIDVRDLATWTLQMIELQQTGIYNAVGPEPSITFETLLRACQKAAGPDAAQLFEIDETFLLDQEVIPWNDLPLWTSSGLVQMAHVNAYKAIAAGLTYRPLEATAADTLHWFNECRTDDAELKTGIDSEKEAAVLKVWKDQ